MKNENTAFLFLVLGWASSPTVAQEHTSVSSISQATLDQYREMYSDSPLCTNDDITLWTCTNNKTDILAMFVSEQIPHDRLHAISRLERSERTLTYPAVEAPPLGPFEYNPARNGDAYVEFYQ
jgi:hypothetical protein